MMGGFNSVARKREKGFVVTCETLIREQVDTVDKAEACRQRLQRNACLSVAFVFVVGGVLISFFSSIAAPILTGMLILCLYIITSTYRARGYVQRYINEMVLSSPSEESPDGADK